MASMDAYLPIISTLATVGSLLVWMVYARLLYISFRHHEQPLIIIHQAHGHGLGSSTLVINLSREAVHIVLVQLLVRVDGRMVTLPMGEYRAVTGEDESDRAVENVMKEGPLRPGDYLSLGGFHGILRAAAKVPGDEGEKKDEDDDSLSLQRLVGRIESVEIRVIAQYSAFSHPVGARKRYRLDTIDGKVCLLAGTALTEQINSFRGRRKVYRWLRESFET